MISLNLRFVLKSDKIFCLITNITVIKWIGHKDANIWEKCARQFIVKMFNVLLFVFFAPVCIQQPALIYGFKFLKEELSSTTLTASFGADISINLMHRDF